MPAFKPSILISDAFGSVGDVTFYHRNGKCFYKKRSHGGFQGTPGQLSSLEVHRRALAAWRTIDQATQEVWNGYGVEAVPHKPPFDNKAHISGQNLFVSAYHGFAILGNEHIPLPQRFEKFPPFAVDVTGAVKENGDLIISVSVTMSEEFDCSRYHLLSKIQLVEPWRGRNPGLMRNYLADADCNVQNVHIVIPGYAGVWDLDLEEYMVHAMFILLDNKTGYRSQAHPASFPIQML